MADEIMLFGPIGFLFVPAGLPHRFTDFGKTMSTWVIFYGPDGSENANSTEKTS